MHEAYLIPTIFSTVRLDRDERNPGYLARVIESVGEHARAFSYKCCLEPGLVEYLMKLEAPRAVDNVCARHQVDNHVASILEGNLGAFRPTKAIIQYYADSDYLGSGWGDKEKAGGIFIHEDIERQDEVLDQEESYMWRRTIADIWLALSKNANVSHLVIQDLFPREVSAWWTPEWTSFIGRLRRLDVAIWGGRCDDWMTGLDTGSVSNVLPGYVDFQGRLGEFFFRYASVLEELRLEAYWQCLLGTGPRNADIASCPLPFDVGHMPKLKKIELKNCIIDEALRTFVQARSDTLLSIWLVDCHSCAGEIDFRRYLTWAKFFQGLALPSSALRSVRITNAEVPLSDEEQASCIMLADGEVDGTFVPLDDEEDNFRCAPVAVEMGEKKRFSYILFDSGRSYPIPDWRSNKQYMFEGHDQRCYDELNQLLKSKI